MIKHLKDNSIHKPLSQQHLKCLIDSLFLGNNHPQECWARPVCAPWSTANFCSAAQVATTKTNSSELSFNFRGFFSFIYAIVCYSTSFLKIIPVVLLCSCRFKPFCIQLPSQGLEMLDIHLLMSWGDVPVFLVSGTYSRLILVRPEVHIMGLAGQNWLFQKFL